MIEPQSEQLGASTIWKARRFVPKASATASPFRSTTVPLVEWPLVVFTVAEPVVAGLSASAIAVVFGGSVSWDVAEVTSSSGEAVVMETAGADSSAGERLGDRSGFAAEAPSGAGAESAEEELPSASVSMASRSMMPSESRSSLSRNLAPSHRKI